MCHSENSQTVDRMLNAGARARSMPGGDSHLNLLESLASADGQPSRILHKIDRHLHTTVDRGLRETVTYRNALGFFPDLGIEMVRAPPLRATETTVT